MVWGRLIFLLYWGSNPGTLVQWKALQNTSKGGKTPTPSPYVPYFINVQKLTIFAYGKENR